MPPVACASRSSRRSTPGALAAVCLCGLQAAGGVKFQADLGSPGGSFNFYCRAFDDTGSPAACPVRDILGSPNVTATPGRRLKSAAPAELLSQPCLDEVAYGWWGRSETSLPADSLGARRTRYAGDAFYYGPPSATQPQDKLKKRIPHSRRWSWSTERGDPTDFVWLPMNKTSGCPEYGWFQKERVAACLTNTWVAFWGDSTTRLMFSALVDFLGNGIEEETFPTHDFTYRDHTYGLDHCGANHCHLLAHFPANNLILTFNFVKSRLVKYPDIWYKLKMQKQAFPEITFPTKPDTILMNSGPWEYYDYDGALSSWIGNDMYKTLFRKFLEHELTKGPNTEFPKLIVLRNTACTQSTGNCEASHVSCVDAMDNVDQLQREAVNLLQGKHQAGTRYLDGTYVRHLPPGYRCEGETGYHLPAVVTDLRLNHALHALCS